MNEDLFHRARPSWAVRAVVLAGAAAAVVVGAASCTVSEKTPFILGNDLADGSTSSGFVAPPEPDAADDGRAPLVEYCPSDRCPAGYTTCPTSLFRCDVDLKTDRDNCGACGSSCPPTNGREAFECVDGKCVLACNPRTGNDCDGIVDNGCETPVSDPKNCGACGNECKDAARPCIFWDNEFGCGCPTGFTACALFGTLLTCVETDSTDSHCGACNIACGPAGDGGTLPDNMYNGCVSGACGPKCRANYGDCDKKQDTGCETLLTTNENCGVCGNACQPGQSCQKDWGGHYVCMCPPGMTVCDGRCVDLATNVQHCGSCGAECPNVDGLGGKSSVTSCIYGTCVRTCAAGRADCNGNREDGCETNTNSDPRNCGGCGTVCDAVAGQACVGGRCVVEPCDQIDAGPVAK